MIKLLYHPHEYGGANRIRVWRTNWMSDQFEVITQGEFNSLENWCTTFNIPLINVEDWSEEEKTSA